MSRSLRLGFLLLALAPCMAAAQSRLIGWGEGEIDTDVRNVPAVQVAAGLYSTGILRADGRVFVRGWSFGTVPQPPAGVTYVEIRLGPDFGCARCSDGNIIAWSDTPFTSITSVPPLPATTTY